MPPAASRNFIADPAPGISEPMATPGATTAEHLMAYPGLRRVPTPKVELFDRPGFLPPELCAELMVLIDRDRRPSTIADPNGDHYFRTSETCDLDESEAPVIDLERRLFELSGIDPAYGEPVQGQRYEVGQEFKPHTDFFKVYELETFSTPAWGQRTWTFMIYLNEPEGGGATRFVDIDLTIQPKRGMAVFWNNLLPSGQPNNFTRHQGMPVTAGTKLIITKWFRMAPRARPLFTSAPVSWTQKIRA